MISGTAMTVIERGIYLLYWQQVKSVRRQTAPFDRRKCPLGNCGRNERWAGCFGYYFLAGCGSYAGEFRRRREIAYRKHAFRVYCPTWYDRAAVCRAVVLDRMMDIQKKRILYICRGGPVYGSQRQLLTLVTRLDRSRFEPVVACVGGGELAENLVRNGIETVEHLRLHPSRKLVHLVPSVLDRYALWRQFRPEGIDLIHCSYQWYGPYAVWLAAKMACPCIVHIRAPIGVRTVGTCACDQADAVIAISRRSARNVEQAGIAHERIAMISDSVDMQVFFPMPEARGRCRAALGLGDKFVFGTVGRVAPTKFTVEFIEAAAAVARHRPEAMFLIVGDQRDSDYARRVQDLLEYHGLSRRVVMAGHRDDMPEVLNACDVLVAMAGGSVMYEAMACGVPVLSAGFTRREDSMHVLHDRTGVVVESRVADEVAGAMVKLMDETAWRQGLARSGLERLAEHLTDAVMVEKTQRLYDEILD
jgi:glycosyltransferase involved in cell wall biosynthesis